MFLLRTPGDPARPAPGAPPAAPSAGASSPGPPRIDVDRQAPDARIRLRVDNVDDPDTRLVLVAGDRELVAITNAVTSVDPFGGPARYRVTGWYAEGWSEAAEVRLEQAGRVVARWTGGRLPPAPGADKPERPPPAPGAPDDAPPAAAASPTPADPPPADDPETAVAAQPPAAIDVDEQVRQILFDGKNTVSHARAGSRLTAALEGLDEAIRQRVIDAALARLDLEHLKSWRASLTIEPEASDSDTRWPVARIAPPETGRAEAHPSGIAAGPAVVTELRLEDTPWGESVALTPVWDGIIFAEQRQDVTVELPQGGIVALAGAPPPAGIEPRAHYNAWAPALAAEQRRELWQALGLPSAPAVSPVRPEVPGWLRVSVTIPDVHGAVELRARREDEDAPWVRARDQETVDLPRAPWGIAALEWREPGGDEGIELAVTYEPEMTALNALGLPAEGLEAVNAWWHAWHAYLSDDWAEAARTRLQAINRATPFRSHVELVPPRLSEPGWPLVRVARSNPAAVPEDAVPEVVTLHIHGESVPLDDQLEAVRLEDVPWAITQAYRVARPDIDPDHAVTWEVDLTWPTDWRATIGQPDGAWSNTVSFAGGIAAWWPYVSDELHADMLASLRDRMVRELPEDLGTRFHARSTDAAHLEGRTWALLADRELSNRLGLEDAQWLAAMRALRQAGHEGPFDADRPGGPTPEERVRGLAPVLNAAQAVHDALPAGARADFLEGLARGIRVGLLAFKADIEIIARWAYPANETGRETFKQGRFKDQHRAWHTVLAGDGAVRERLRGEPPLHGAGGRFDVDTRPDRIWERMIRELER